MSHEAFNMAIGLAMLRPATDDPVFRVPGSNTANCNSSIVYSIYNNCFVYTLLLDKASILKQ